MTGGFRDGDQRYEQITGRRPMVEATLAAVADPGAGCRRAAWRRRRRPADRGWGARVASRTSPASCSTRVSASPADLVVATTGRRSALPMMLASIGKSWRSARTREVGAARVHLLLPVVPVGRRRPCRRCSGRRCSTTTRCRSSLRRPTTARGPWALRPAPPICGSAACRRRRRVDLHRGRLPAGGPLDRRRSRRRTSRRCPPRLTGAPAWSSTAN